MNMTLCRINGELTAYGRNEAMKMLLATPDPTSVPVWHLPGAWMKRVLLTATCMLLAGCYGHRTTVNIPIPPGLTEAPTGLESPPLTNGFESQADMDGDLLQFEQLSILPQLGPRFNNTGCITCHFNPEPGGNSAVFEHRIGPDEPGDNIASATLIHAGSVPGFSQQVAPVDATNALRRSLNLMGDGFVEQIDDNLLKYIAQVNGGQYVMVPVLENKGALAVGRFGWKDQEATLLSFAGDANFNEIGDCNRLVPSPLNNVDCFNGQIEDSETPPADNPFKIEDIDFYASFMRSLKAPPRGITKHSLRGEVVFTKIGCSWCHIPTLYTRADPFSAPSGHPTRYKFHPFGDFLLHDIGTGDGIMQGSAPANKVRTAPLWGLGNLERFLHDGRAYDILTAIQAHRGEANFTRKKFNRLTREDQWDLLDFLSSL